MAAINPRALRVADLVRLLNSTSMGEVVGSHTVYRQRDRAGFLVGDGKTVDLLRYTGWLVWQRHDPAKRAQGEPDETGSLSGYDAKRERERNRQAVLSASGRNIGELPNVADPDRKAKAETDFRYFCETYFPETFHLRFSDDHLKVIRKTEHAVLNGGLFAMAMPRASGKTTIAETACLWAMLYGHRKCIMLIGADLDSSTQMLDNLKMELECNELLLEDFPAAIYPIRCLDGIAQRTNGQLYNGKRTYINWTARNIILPTIDGIPSSGCAVIARGITGKIRGFKMAHPAGGSVRPDLVVIDDPQTDESAKSLSQSHDRERVLAGAVLGLAGPDRKIAGIMPCTVIHKGDMADNILDRDKHPEWQGERTKMVYSFPDSEELWDQYARVLSEGLRNGDGTEPATEYYREHRDEMDAGSKVAWADRFNEDELSAIQHAMNLKIRDEAAFWAEYQNEPIDDEVQDDRLTADMVAEKINGRERYAVPSDCNTLTMFIDVQGKALYYTIVAWTDEFTGYIVDYGTYPDQTLSYFTLRDIRTTLFDLHPGTGQEGAWYAGFDALCKLKLNREWMRDDGSALRISRCLIDANDGNASDVVYQFCRQCAWPSAVMPSRAKGVTASMIPFSDYKRKRGDRVGHNWRIPASNGRRVIRYLLHDANYWKSFCRSRWLVAMGDPGCLSLFSWRKRSSEANAPMTAPLSADTVRHRMFAEQVTAEYSVRTEGRGRTVDEWKLLPGRDNHFLDCITGCAVAASEQGVILEGTEPSHPIKRPRLKLSDIQKRKG